MWSGIASAFVPVLLHLPKLLDVSLQTAPKIKKREKNLQNLSNPPK
jgi:hypothetical protein